MGIDDDINKVKRNISGIYERRRVAAYAISLEFAAIALNYFRAVQSGNKFWENQTNQAMNLFFTKAFKRGNVLGWLAAHGISYGVYLELANDRRHEAIRPVIQRFAGRFFNAVKELYG